MNNSKQEPLFDLIKGMSKAEKRNFKLYATRLTGNQDAKFLALFDVLDSLDEYDETKILKKCPVKKEQIPNMKAHLFRQILISIRLLNVQRDIGMQIREQIDFARILYDKGFYKHSLKMLDKAKELAMTNEQHTLTLEIVEYEKAIKSLHISRAMIDDTESISREATDLCTRISASNELSNLSILLYGLYLKLGYVRSPKDQRLVDKFFAPKLQRYSDANLSFPEKVYYYQAMAWYNYIRYNFIGCYKHACLWTSIFDSNPQMKFVMYDNYLKGYARLLDGLFFMRSYKRYELTMRKIESERELICGISENAEMIYYMVYYVGRINSVFLEGSFDKAHKLIEEVYDYVERYDNYMDIHHKMMFYYKIACLYFGNDDYKNCIKYLQMIIPTRDPQIRRDIQCYARILNLIASYEAGLDHNLDYQIRSVYAFLVKMNDMHEVQHEMIHFIKKLNSFYSSDFKQELIVLYEKLKPFESHPYERRTFFYLDILAWLESKINGMTVAQIIQKRYHDGLN